MVWKIIPIIALVGVVVGLRGNPEFKDTSSLQKDRSRGASARRSFCAGYGMKSCIYGIGSFRVYIPNFG